MSAGRVSAFLTIVLGIWALMHLYVFWRLASVPWVSFHISRRTLIIGAVLLWLSYPGARFLNSRGLETIGVPLEFLASNWIGVLFLLFSFLLIIDVFTLGGVIFTKHQPAIRGAVVIGTLVISAFALVQGLRPPIVRDYEVEIPNLPKEHSGLLLVAISDVHLGNLIRGPWMERLVDRINGMEPHMVAVVGDLFDGEPSKLEALVPVLKNLHAPMGVWAVTGNHEYYVGVDRCVSLMEQAGFSVLRNSCEEAAPGIVVAGVDDLTASEQFGQRNNQIERTLEHRPPGITILLSHSPLDADKAARMGASLMLSGHTHNGQIWPFNFLVKSKYPLVSGRYEVNGMPVIVSRGVGTWGPRMRLWQPSELLRITLKSPGTAR